MNQDSVFRMQRLLDKINVTAKEQIVTERVTTETQLLLLLKELIKEQVPNESTSNTAR